MNGRGDGGGGTTNGRIVVANPTTSWGGRVSTTTGCVVAHPELGSPVFAMTRAWEVEEDDVDVASDDPSFCVGGLREDEERGMEGG